MCAVRIVNPNCCLLDNCYIFRSYGRVFPRKSRGGRGERGGSSHVVICDLMRRYGCRTSSSSGREKLVDDRRVIFWCFRVKPVGHFEKKRGGKRKGGRDGRVSGNGIQS